MEITRETTIGELLEKHPEKAHVLVDAGMHCIGCMISETEPIEMACAEFGVDVDDLLAELNKPEEE